MATRKKIKYEARKLSDNEWGLFISKTEICYGTSTGKFAKKLSEVLANRLNRVQLENKQEKTSDNKENQKKEKK